MNFISKVNRREFMVTSFTIGGGFALGLMFARGQAEAAAIAAEIGRNPWEASSRKEDMEVNPWLLIGADDTVTIRVAQSETGQGTVTSWSQMIVEALECAWS